MTDLTDRLHQYNPPDRTIDEQRQISVDIHEAATELERLTAECDRLRNQWPLLLPELDRLRLDRARLEYLLSPGAAIPDEASYFWCDDDERLTKCRAAIDAALAARQGAT